MRDLFLADAHLRHPTDANYQRLLAFLQSEAPRLRTLYLLGDIFEFWMGFSHVVYSDYLPLLNLLRQLRQQGVRIVYVEGNHDFNLGPYFEREMGCTVLPDGGNVDVDGRSWFLAHGDLADPHDRGYRLLRRLLRSRLIRWLGRIVHPDTSWRIAAWASRNSTGKRTRRSEEECRAILLPYAAHRFAAGHDVVICGHYHTPFMQKTASGLLISLGDWIEQFSYAVYEDGAFRLETFDA